MPVNRNALIRYRTIDKCLQNRRRKWTIENLIDACNDALYEYEGIEKGVSLRTIRLDLNAMRSDKLGYNAPIIVKEKKYYSYEDDGYSITNIPLTAQDLDVLKDASALLRQFKGFNHFAEMNEMLHKLEDKIYSEQYHRPPVIDFEKNELLAGIHWLDLLHKSILGQTALTITYQSFKARQAQEFIFFPCLLKEYRNRWFLLGTKKKNKELLTLALDRIVEAAPDPREKFLQPGHFDASSYFNDIIGVTRNTGSEPVLIEFWASQQHAPYIRTKPIHHSQQELRKHNGGLIFSICVIPNFEMEREFLGFGEGIKVLSPARLVRTMRSRAKKMHDLYAQEEKIS